MRLTKTIRSAFVRAAMADVPYVNYDEQINKVTRAAAEQAFDELVGKKGVYKKALVAGWINEVFVKIGRSHVYVFAPSNFDFSDVRDEVTTLLEQQDAQEKHRETLQKQLLSVANSCTTRKQLAQRLPEFEKYLPAEGPGTDRTVPALANVVADFVKAGWLKSAA